MKQKRLTTSFCTLFGTVLLLAFSEVWHPLLHHACGHHDTQELSRTEQTRPLCVVCTGLLQSDEMPPLHFSLPHDLPPGRIELPEQCTTPALPGEHAPRAPPVC